MLLLEYQDFICHGGSADDVAMTQKKFPIASMVRTIGRHNNSQCVNSAKKFPLAAIFVT